MQRFMEKIQKYNKMIQIVLLGIIFYFIGIKKDYKYDEVLILLFLISLFIENNFIKKIKRTKLNKESKILFFLIGLNIVLFSHNYYLVFKESGYIIDDRIDWISSVIIKTFSLFLLLLLIKIKNRQRYLVFLSLVTTIPIFKILKYGIKTNFKYRIMGFWANPNYVGFYLGIALILSLLIALQINKKIYKILFFSISIISFLEIVFITKSRNAILAVVVSLVLLALLKIKEKTKAVLFAGSFISIVGLILFKINSRFLSLFNLDTLKHDGRIAIYSKAFEIIKNGESLYFGKGFAYFYNIKFVEEWGIRAFHNEWLELLINQGLVGMIAYALLYVYVLYLLIKRIKKSSEDWISVLGIVLWLYLLMLGMFDNTIGGGRVFEIVFIVFGLALNTNNSKESEDNERSC
ncbi:MAG: O-antigen ligase family protein [Fusobacteriaceae bacterium]